VGGLPDEIDHRSKTVVRVEEEDVLFPDCREYVFFFGKLWRDGLLERGVLEIGAVEREEFHEVCHSHRIADPVEHVGADPQFFLKHLHGILGHGRVDLDPYRRPACPLFHDLFDRCQKVRCLIDLDIEICITGDAEGISPDYFEAREEEIEVCGNKVFEINEMDVLVVVAFCRCRYAYEPGEEAGGHLDPGEELLFVLVADYDSKVEREVRDEGKRVGGIECERDEDREDLLDKIGAERIFLFLVQVLVGRDEDPGLCEFREDLAVPAVVLEREFGKECLFNCNELL